MTERISIDVGAWEGAETAPDLWGLFVEDLNDALDGGLNAEGVRNGDFEFDDADQNGWQSLTGWAVDGDVRVRTDDPVHPNNAHYVRLNGPAVLENEGWDGVGVEAGRRLRLTCFARTLQEPARLAAAVGDGADDLVRAEFSVSPARGSSCRSTSRPSPTGGEVCASRPLGPRPSISTASHCARSGMTTSR
ncbi:hypothetical protein GCM10029992_51330 [Glycomyces albus]